jgi:methyl-accepting chemotaxis protein
MPQRNAVRVRRRRILSRPADQFRTSLVPTLGAAVLLVLLVAFVHHVAAVGTRDLSLRHPAGRDVLQDQAVFIETALAAGAVVCMFGVLAVGLVHSRRLIGALFAMHRRIVRLAEGDLDSPMRLRRGDYFHDVAEAINDAAASFRAQAREDLADADDLISILDRSPHAGPLREGIRDTLVRLRERKRTLLGAHGAPGGSPRPVPEVAAMSKITAGSTPGGSL